MKENKRPLRPAEREAVFAAADAHRIRGQPDVWCGQLVRFFAWTGVHEAVFCDPDRFNLRVEHGTLNWNRAKTGADLELPIKAEMKPWIDSFLSTPRPSSERRIHQILDEIGEAAGIKLNFLRLRHTAMVMFHREMGLGVADCMRLLGVSAKTFVTYAERPLEDIEEDLRRKGF